MLKNFTCKSRKELDREEGKYIRKASDAGIILQNDFIPGRTRQERARTNEYKQREKEYKKTQKYKDSRKGYEKTEKRKRIHREYKKNTKI